ncbi:hypothetical protein JCM10212_000626 [Sporobolomyces blumeae]
MQLTTLALAVLSLGGVKAALASPLVRLVSPAVDTARSLPLLELPRRSNRSTLVAALSDNAFSALSLDTGATIWTRWHHEELQTPQVTLCDNVAILSSPTGALLEAVDATTGTPLWAEPRTAQHGSYPTAECIVRSGQAAPTLILLRNGHVKRIEPRTGEIVWDVELPDAASLDVVSTGVESNPGARFQALVARPPSRTPVLLSFDLDTGSHSTLASSVYDSYFSSTSSRGVMAESSSGNSVHLSITSTGDLQALSLPLATGPNSASRPVHSVPKGRFVEVKDVGLKREGIVVATRQDGKEVMLRVLQDGPKVDEVWSFSAVRGVSRFATSVDSAGGIHLARLSWSPVLRLSTLDVVSLNPGSSQPIVSGKTLGLDLSGDKGRGLELTLDTHKLERNLLPEFTVVVSSESIPLQAWTESKLRWTTEPEEDAVKPTTGASEVALVQKGSGIEAVRTGKGEVRSAIPLLFGGILSLRTNVLRVSLFRPQSSAPDSMISAGRIDDKRVSLFKYRNANLAVFATVSTSSSSKLTLHLVDSTSGLLVQRIEAPFDVMQTDSRVGLAVVEDWVVVTYRTKSFGVPISILLSIYLQADLERTLVPIVRSFMSSRPIRVEGFTSTRLAIASRDCLVSDSLGQVVALSRRSLNPFGAPKFHPKAKSDKAILEPLPTGRVIGRAAELVGPRSIKVSPGPRESESILSIFAAGSNLALAAGQPFETVVRPSGSFDALGAEFNRVQIVTVVGVLVVSLILARSSAKKQMMKNAWDEQQ